MEEKVVFKMDEMPDELRELCVLWTKPGVFIKDKVKLASDVEHYVRKRVDQAMRSAAREILNMMPEDSWDITCKHLPKYHQRDEILWSSQMQKILDDEMEEPEEIERYLQESGRETGSVAGIELSLRLLDLDLYLESKQAMDERRVREDAMYLQEIHNNLASRGWTRTPGGEMDKFDSLIWGWLGELRKKAGLLDDKRMKTAFIEEVGAENWEEPDWFGTNPFIKDDKA